MDELRECPWCGEKPAGLSICEGSTFRWVIGSCPSCGANPGEIRRDTSISAEDRHIEDEKIAIAAWNTRAQPKPEVAPDDEALITSLEMESAAVSECFQNGSQDEIHEATDDLKKAREALRRRIAELRATSLKYQLAFGDRDNDAHRLADRVAELKAALAACRDKTIEDACAAVDATILDERQSRITQAAIRALKTKEPTNG